MPPDRQPPACSLDRETGPARRARWQALAERALLAHVRTPDGARQHYRPDPGIEAELDALVALEAECCPFLAFGLEREDGALVLGVSGPPEAAPILELFANAGETGAREERVSPRGRASRAPSPETARS